MYVKLYVDMFNLVDRMNFDKLCFDLFYKFLSDNGWVIVIFLKDLVNVNEIIIC